jgi:pheromone shutdown protein TraB
MVKTIYLVATNHISHESIEKIRNITTIVQPQAIAIELDEQRLHTLLESTHQPINQPTHQIRQSKHIQKPQQSKQTLFFAYLDPANIFLRIVSLLQQYFAKKLGTKPGVDMLEGFIYSQQAKIPCALIDVPIQHTIQRLRQIKKRTYFRLFFDTIFSLMFPKRFLQKTGLSVQQVQITKLDKIPPTQLVLQLVNYMKKQYPALYRVLITIRNEYMCNQLHMMPFDTIVCVIGAAHMPGMIEILQNDYKGECLVIGI